MWYLILKPSSYLTDLRAALDPELDKDLGNNYGTACEAQDIL